jgi:DNA-binding PadR family transcriptional regulator
MAKSYRTIRESKSPPLFKKGDLKYVILDLLDQKARYGYEVIWVLKDISNGFYTPSAGTVYPTLQMLKDRGYASVTLRDKKKIYSITDKGREFFAENKEFAEEIKHRMRGSWNPDDMKHIIGMMRGFGDLHKLIRQARKADAETISSIIDVISRAYDQIEDILE